jgi:hypothetical protein
MSVRRGGVVTVAVGFLAELLCACHAVAAPTSADFLKISMIPRAAGMAEACVAIADAAWPEVNPANLTSIDGTLFTFSHAAWFEDISLEMLSIGTSSGRHGFGVSLAGLHTEPLQEYDQSDRHLGQFRYYDFLLSATYARAVASSLRLGATGKTIYEKIGWDSATGFALDLGAGYSTPLPALRSMVSAGAAVRNLGSKMGYFEKKYDLPLAYQFGLCIKPDHLPGEIEAILAADYRAERDAERGFLFGLEIGFAHTVALRLGAKSLTGSDRDGGNATAGFGLNIRNILVDYSYVDFGTKLGATHRLAVALKTGPVLPTPEASR